MRRVANLSPQLPEVCRLGLATRGNTHLSAGDIEAAIDRGVNYFNWCGHPDGLSHAVRRLGNARKQVVIAAQFEARSAADAQREFARMQDELKLDCIDILTLYYVESQSEWDEITGPGGAWEYLAAQKQRGQLKMIGLTSHQRSAAAEWAQTGKLDLLMVRYNAAHRGAERDVFPVTQALRIPVVTFTGLRWKALLGPSPEDPPDFKPPSAIDCYRFCLEQPAVAVSLAAPGNRAELEQDLELLGDWRPAADEQRQLLLGHGERIRKHAGTFW